MEKIIKLRQKMDGLDKEIMDLLSSRFELSSSIIEEKGSIGLGSFDGAREEFILDRAKSHGPKVEKLYRELLRISKEK